MSEAKIRFWDLGRTNAKGEFVAKGTPDQVNRAMYNEFYRYLASRDISFDNGKIYVGFRAVGSYAFVGKE